jgi:RNA polymerase sigma factor (sigma-70 family)
VETLNSDVDDRDLERLFSNARRYPLLTAEQEREIDQRKWAAVEAMQHLLTQDEGAMRYLRELSSNSAVTALDIAYFENRDHHFILRRELAEYLPGGKRADAMEALHTALRKRRSERFLAERLAALELPASLAVGLTCVVLRRSGVGAPDTVADALEQWECFWTQFASQEGSAELAASSRISLEDLLERYSDARDTLTMHNLRLVYSIAGRYRGKGVNYLDLVQEGTLGLIRAAEKYDHRKGFRFRTYCFNWITQAVRRHVGDTGNMIRYPTHVQEQVSKLYRLRLEEKQRTGVEPTEAELAEAAGMTLEKARDLLQLRNIGVSLDAPQYDDEETTLLDAMPGGPFAASESDAETESLHERLLSEMTMLDTTEREVVVARWGLHAGPPLTRAEIADKLSVSREWVRQLERSALAKLSRNERIRAAFEDYIQDNVETA